MFVIFAVLYIPLKKLDWLSGVLSGLTLMFMHAFIHLITADDITMML